MPLLLPVLVDALIKLDEPAPPQDPVATAEAWYKAWWTYASQMALWNPVSLTLIEAAVRPVFLAALLPGCVPNPIPGTFYLALELACTAGWLAGSAIPSSLLPLIATPVPLVPPPPGLLVLALVALVPVGLLSPTKEPTRIGIATAIDVWSHLFLATPVTPPPPPAPPVLPIS